MPVGMTTNIMQVRFMDLVRDRFNDRGFTPQQARGRSAENVGLGVAAMAIAAGVIALSSLVFPHSTDRRSPFIVTSALAGVFGFYGLLMVFRGLYGLITGAGFNVTGPAADGESKHRAGFAFLVLLVFLGGLFGAVVMLT